MKWWNRWLTGNKQANRTAPLIEELEPRVLLSADAAGIFVPDPGGLQQQTPTELLLDDNFEPAPTEQVVQEEARSLELVFVDTDSPDYQSIVDSLTDAGNEQRQFEVIVLDNNRDGVWQISQALQNYSEVDAIHLVSHGDSNGVDLGNTRLDADSLQVQQDQFLAWSNYLTEDADILIYGCNLAAGEDGHSLMRELSQLTGADVAASDDLTGHASLGGDWELESHIGLIETEVFASRSLVDSFGATLGTPEIDEIKTADLDNDGFIDAVRIRFSEAISDSTVRADDWTIAGASGLGFSSTTNGDTANDDDIYITFTDGVLSDTATPLVSYTQDDPTDPDIESLSTGDPLANNDNSNWWNQDWLNRTMITFDNSASLENLTNFPVLIQLSSSEVDFGRIKAGGADIRFVDNDGTELDFEIESWDDTGETANIWVRVQQIDAGSTTDHIHIYYNNADATTTEDAATTWGDFAGVWHLNESGSGDHVDSTGNASNGVRDGNTQSAGKVGNAQHFDGTDDAITIASNSELDMTGSSSTIEAWINLEAIPGNDNWFDVTGIDGKFGIYVTENAGDVVLDAYWDHSGGSDDLYQVGNTNIPVGEWTHLAITFDGTDARGYVNGELDWTEDLRGGGGTTLESYAGPLYIGDWDSNNDDKMDGLIDEVRYSSTDRSADWIEASYLSQSGSFATFGNRDTTSSDGVAPTVSITRDDANPTAASSITFSVDFSEDVVNVSADDFDVALTDTATGGATVVVGNAGDADDSTYTVTVNGVGGDGTVGLDIDSGNVDITDTAANALNNTPTADEVYITIGSAPEISSIETADLDGDGFIDALHVTFSESILDSTVTADDWNIAGASGLAFSSTTNGDTADDSDIYLTFADGVLATDAQPGVTYVQDGPTDPDITDLSGAALADIDDSQAWWDTDWLNRTQITFDNSGSTENLTNFPVLITLDSSNVDFSRIKAGGADIRFVDSDGTLLDYEIETWDDVAETATVWVRVGQIDAGSSTDFIHAYYNNAAATDAQDAAQVWSSGFTAVWHLSDTVTDEQTSGTYADSTGNHDGAQVNSGSTAGVIGDALDLDGANDYVNIPNDAALTPGVAGVDSSFSVSAWIAGDTGSASIVGKNTNALGDEWELWLDSGLLTLSIDDSTGATIGKTATTPVSGAWQHVMATYDGSETNAGIKLYIDGVEQATTLYTDGSYAGLSNTTAPVQIGTYDDGGNSYDFNGQIDEVRLSSAERSAEWVEASYLAQSGGSSFASFGPTQTATTDGAGPVASITRDDSNPTDAASVTFSVDFSENVANVNADDFDVALTGSATGDATVVVGNAGDADDSTYTVTVTGVGGDGTVGLDIDTGNVNITDAAGNALINAPVTDEVYNVDNTGPEVSAIETADLDGDGFIDALHITFDEAILDSSVVGNDWDIAGVTGESFSSTTNGDTANDSDIYITFTDGVLDTGATPAVTYTQDDPTDADITDIFGNALENIAGGDAWWDQNWLSRTQITFDNSSSTENLTDFAVLVRLDPSVIDFDKIKAGGADIRFVDDDGTPLDYEIDSWDDTPGSESATVWVRVQQVDQGSTTDYIHLYYNNTAATDAQNAAGIWESGIGVYHLDEDPGPGGAGDIKDSDGTANDGTAEASMVSGDLVAGQIGDAIDFDDALNQYVEFASADTGDTFTISAWIRPDSARTGIQTLVANSMQGNSVDGFRFFINGSAGFGSIYFETGNGVDSEAATTAAGVINFDVWNHVAVEVDRASGSATIYHNGVEVNGGDKVIRTDFNTNNAWRITQMGAGGGGSDFQGTMDEFRLETVARSAEEIEAAYLSQNNVYAFNTFGVEEVRTEDAAAPVASISRDDTNPTNAASVTFSVDFSEDVSNVNADDFDVALTGSAGANATVSVTDAGDADDSTYAVTVSGITGDGTVGLDIDTGNVDIVDAAGNAMDNAPTTDEVYTVDNTVPAPSFALAADTGASAVDGITNDATVNVTLAGDVDSWEYSLDGGSNYTTGTGTSFELADNTTYAIGDIVVRQTDTAGNQSATSSNAAAITTDMSVVAPSFALAADTGASAVDGITNDATVNVTLAGDADSWEYSLDGGSNYTTGSGTSFELADNTTYAIGDIVVRQTDTAGNQSATSSNTAAIQTDMTAPGAPSFTLAADTGASAVDGITNDATVNVTLAGDAASWEYSLDGGSNYTTGSGTSFELADNTTYAIGDIVVRQTDTAGNQSATSSNAAAITTDMSVAAPSFALAADTGASAVDGITNDATVNVTLAGDADSWEYSLDGGSNYTTGSGTSFELADNTTYAIGDIVVRQTDTAGNQSATSSNTAAIQTDMTAPGAPSFTLAADTGASAVDGITNDATVNVTLAGDADSWEYSLDGGSNYTTGSGTSFELADNTTYAIGDIVVRQTDTAGNQSATSSNAAAITTDMSVAAPSFALAADTGASAVDGITNDATVNVTLAGDVDSWEYSLDGGSNYTAGTGTSFELADNTTYAIGDIVVRQTDTAGNQSATSSNASAITTDMSVVAPSFALAADTGASAVDGITNDATVNVTLAGDAASWEYSLDGGSNYTTGSGTSFELADNTTYAIGDIVVRQTDTAGNQSATSSNAAAITTDMSVAAPSFALAADTGASAVDGITNDATVNVTLAGDVDSWEYSLDGGSNYTTGTGTSFELADNTTYAIGDIVVRQTDTAGNQSATSSNAAAITTDMSVVAPSFALAADTGASAVDGITNDATVNVTLAGDAASWEYSLDGGSNYTTGSGTSFELADNTTYAIGDIVVRQTDTAGNQSATSSNTAAIQTDMTAPGAPSFTLAADTGASAVDGITNDATVNVTLAGDAASWEYSLDGGSNYTTGSGTSFELADNTTYAIGDIVVRQTDTAGNQSATSSNAAAITTDMSVAAPSFALAADTGASAVDGITNDATVNVTLAGDVDSWEYSLDGGSNYTAGTGTSFELADNTTYAIGDIVVRQTDTAGNQSATSSNTAAIQTDMTAPGAPSFTLAADTGASAVDGITNDATVNVTLAGDAASWEYSLDGGSNYTTGSGTSFELADNTTYAIGDIVVRQTDTAGNQSATSSNAAAITTDMSVAAPSFALAADTGASAVDGITNDATVNVTLAGDAASWEYSLDGGSNYTTGSGTSFELADNTTYAIGDIVVRQTDTAGNQSATSSNTAAIQTDMTAPGAPSFTLAADTGASAVDGITNDATVNVTLAGDAASWEYSLDGGSNYTTGSGTSFELADNTTYAIGDIVVRQTDTAGNQSATSSNAAAITTDMSVAAPSFALAADTGASAVDGITNDATVNVTLAGDAASWEYSLDGGSNYTTGSGTSFELADNTTYAIGDIVVRQTDTAGNQSATSSNTAAIQTDMTAPGAPSFTLAADTGASAVDGITNDATVNVTLAGDAASWEYSLDGGSNYTTGSGTSFELADNTTYAIGDIVVRQTDTAGNQSATSSNAAAITTDMSVVAPSFALAADTGASAVDGITNDATVNVTLAGDAASWEYSLDGGSNYTTGSGTSFELADNTTYAIGDIVVRQTDTAGNQSATSSNTAAIQTDMTAPGAPSFTLAADTGASAVDGITNDATVNVTLAGDAASWEYSLDGGSNYTAGTGTSFELADNTTYAIGDIVVRQTDTAGNQSATSSNTAAIQTDMTAPGAPSFTLAADTGASAVDGITNDATVNVTLAGDAASWEYSLDGGSNYTTGSGTSFELADNTTYAIGDIVVRQTDTAGNQSATSSNAAAITTDMSVAAPSFALAADTGASAVDGITNDATVNVTLAGDAASWEYSLDGGSNYTTGSGTSFELADNTTYAIGDIVVRQTDTAGNQSATSSNTAAITTDMSAPSAPAVTSITDDTGTADTITSDSNLVFSGTAEAGSSVEVFLDGSSIGTTTADGTGNWSFDHTGTSLADNSYTLTAQATDAAANTSATSASFNFTVDTVGPAAVITALSNDTGTVDGVTTDSQLVFSGTAEAGNSVEIFLDGASIGTVAADGSGNWSLDYTSTTLADGDYTLTAQATDSATAQAGNISANFDFTIDSTAPTAAVTAISNDTGPADGITSDNTLEFSGTAEPNNTVQVFLDSGTGAVSLGTVSADGSGNWTLDYTGTPLADGDYTATAQATDPATGLVGAVSGGFTIRVDTTQPANNAPSGTVSINNTTPAQGDVLSASDTLTDIDGVGAITYHWQRDTGSGFVDIGTSGATYTATQEDVGAVIRVEARYTDFRGFDETVPSSETDEVTNVDDAGFGDVSIDNLAPVQGDTLSASNTLDDPDGLSGTVAYQWQRDGEDIAGQNGTIYVTTQADVGAVISVVASYVDDLGGSGEFASVSTAPVADVNDAVSGSVAITGAAAEDQTLTVSNSLADPDGVGDISYQWQRDGVDIVGATGDTYTLDQSDVGTQIAVVASFIDGGDTLESVASAATAPVENVNDAATGTLLSAPSDTGPGTVLTVNNDIFDEDGISGTVNFQWMRNGTAIAGATADSYTLSEQDADSVVTVRASYTDDFGTDETLESDGVVATSSVNDPTEEPAPDDVDVPVDVPDGVNIPDENTNDDNGSPAPVVPPSVDDPAVAPPALDIDDPVLDSDPGTDPVTDAEDDLNIGNRAGSRGDVVDVSDGDAVATEEDSETGLAIAQAERDQELVEDLLQLIQGENQDENISLKTSIAGNVTLQEVIAQDEEFNIVNDVLTNHALWDAIDRMNEEMTLQSSDKLSRDELVVQFVSTSGLGLFAAITVYALRGGALMASWLSTMPLWGNLDPLPVVRDKKDEEEEEEKLRKRKATRERNAESMFSGQERA